MHLHQLGTTSSPDDQLYKFIKEHWDMTISKLLASTKSQIKTMNDGMRELFKYRHLITSGKTSMTIEQAISETILNAKITKRPKEENIKPNQEKRKKEKQHTEESKPERKFKTLDKNEIEHLSM